MISYSSILFALGFGNLGILFWLAAVGVPLLVHLWHRRKHHEEPFAAIAFVLSAVQKHSRRIRIQNWLLLAVRTAIVLLIVLAVAEPYVESLGVDIVSRKRTHKLLVLDGSYSMAYRPADNSRFYRAKQLAAKIVRQSPQGDGFTLILMGEPPQTIVSKPAFDANNFIDEIDNLRLPHAGADLSQTLTMIDELLSRTRRDHPDLEQSQVIFLTDLGTNTWQPPNEAVRALEARQTKLSNLANHASMVVIDLGQPKWSNQLVSNLTMRQPYATTMQAVHFDALIRVSDTETHNQDVEFLVDGQTIKKEQIRIPAAAEATVQFSHRFLEPGSHSVEVRIATDRLETDNHCWLAVNVRPNLRVLCVQGGYNETYHLSRALAPVADETSMVHVSEVSESELLEQDLEQFDCVFLCNVGQFTREESRLLRSYVQGGGGLVFFLGDRADPQRYNQELGEERPAKERLLPVLLSGPAEEGNYRFDPLDYLHSIVAPFRNREQAGLLTTPIYRYQKLAMLESSPTARVALSLTNGDPAIVEEQIGQGRVLVVAIPAYFDQEDTSPWTLFPVWHSFLPVVQEVLSFVVAARDEQFLSRVGEPIGMFLPDATKGASVSITSPEGEKLSVSAQNGKAPIGWTCDETSISGIYSASLGPPLSTTQYFAVNLDTRESDLSKISVDKLPQALRVQTSWQDLDQQSDTTIIKKTGLHRWFLYAVLTLLLAEVYLAWFFGRSGA